MHLVLLHALSQICGLTVETCGHALAVGQLHLSLKSLRAENQCPCQHLPVRSYLFLNDRKEQTNITKKQVRSSSDDQVIVI